MWISRSGFPLIPAFHESPRDLLRSTLQNANTSMELENRIPGECTLVQGGRTLLTSP